LLAPRARARAQKWCVHTFGREAGLKSDIVEDDLIEAAGTIGGTVGRRSLESARRFDTITTKQGSTGAKRAKIVDDKGPTSERAKRHSEQKQG